MSDFRAIGGVSATLKALLLDRMELPDGLTSVPVTLGPPPFSSKDNDPHKEDPRINLFLYRVTENGSLQNQEIPGHGSPGAFGHPPLSLNLHYLVTAYGNLEEKGGAVPPLYDDTTAHFLLGSAMRVLHDTPIVTEKVTTVRPPSGTIVLHPSLWDDFEQVKLTLEPLTLEDITKVWTALALRYHLSASYVVNVVQIESRRQRRFPRPVGPPASATTPPLPGDPPSPGPWVYVLTLQTPTVTDLRVRRAGETVEQPFAYARLGDTLVLRGTSLSGPETGVRIGDILVPASFAHADRVEAVIPDATIPGGGAIPAESRLQPGVSTVQVSVRDPFVPQSAFSSNEAAFMLVPAVNPATLVYAAGPPRTLTFQGTRLLGTAPGGETILGRSAVPRAAYLNATPTQLTVPLPDTLPTRGVHVLVGSGLLDPIHIGLGAQALDITIGGVTKSVTANHLPASLARSTAAGILGSLIHDAFPTDPSFTGARADLWNDRLIVVPGGLISAIMIASSTGSTLASDLGLAVAPPPGAGSALLSGLLTSPPPLSSAHPRLQLTIGAQPAITVALAKPISLAALAVDLEAKIRAASGAPEYLNASVAISGSQLLVLPGTADTVTFAAAPGDDTTVVELQLHARLAVRVRVNGAESFDPAVVELPQ